MLAEYEGHAQKHTASTDTLREPFSFMHILHSPRWWPSAWACPLWFPQPWRVKKKKYKIQQLRTRREHFKQTMNNHGLFNRWPLNLQTHTRVFGENKKHVNMETGSHLRLPRVPCSSGLPVCAWSAGICRNYTHCSSVVTPPWSCTHI